MRKEIVRAAGLAGLAAVALALAGAAAAPALAAATDTGGTFTLGIANHGVKSLAKDGIVILPTGAGTATAAKYQESITLQVSGGNATYVGLTGTLDLAGGVKLFDGSTGRSVTLTGLTFSYDTGRVSVLAGGRRIPLAVIGGDEVGTSADGPPATQTFKAAALSLTATAAKYLDQSLHATYFAAQTDLGSLSTTYDIATGS
jgi:hypothetical protein